MTPPPAITVPDGYTLHSENSAHILLPSSNEAFLNPVQEFNRDLSVACIRVWSEEMNRVRKEKWRTNREKFQESQRSKRMKKSAGTVSASDVVMFTEAEPTPEPSTSTQSVPPNATSKEPEYNPQKIVVLEALSATGLRSIRYANEIPLIKYVIANDLDPTATAAMRRNVEINGLGPAKETPGSTEDAHPSGADVTPLSANDRLGKVRVNEGDACALLYSHRASNRRVDVVDLDPYGTAAPFVDGAVQSVQDGGLLCVTCTDLAVLGSTNFSEKCFANYGGVPVKTEYCHEAALRLVLHMIATSAARYGRYIEPLLSLSIDFYVRVFVRVNSGALEVKRLASQSSVYYVCQGCQSFHEQPFGRTVDTTHERTSQVNTSFKTHAGPPVSNRCPECDSTLHLAGPMWSGNIHSQSFVRKVLDHLGENEEHYGTALRMKGMLTVASEELNTPFYFTPTRIAGFFHCVTPSLDDVASALLHAGHAVSRSHACPGSLKTAATREDIHDIFRSWVRTHPVKMENIGEKSPARRLLAKEPRTEANFTRHPSSVTAASKVKLVRYQQNPTANWGPGTRAGKRKRNGEAD